MAQIDWVTCCAGKRYIRDTSTSEITEKGPSN